MELVSNIISMADRRMQRDSKRDRIAKLLAKPPDPVELIQKMSAIQHSMGLTILELKNGHIMHNDAILEIIHEMKEQRALFHRALKGLADLAGKSSQD